MELDFTTEQRKFRDELRGYFANMMTDALTAELSSGGEGGGPEFRKAMMQMGQDGLLGLSWPKEYGGQERSPIEQFIFADEVQSIGFPLPFLTLSTVGPILREYGSQEQRRHFCPRILAGEIFFCHRLFRARRRHRPRLLEDDRRARRRRVGDQRTEDVDELWRRTPTTSGLPPAPIPKPRSIAVSRSSSCRRPRRDIRGRRFAP